MTMFTFFFLGGGWRGDFCHLAFSVVRQWTGPKGVELNTFVPYTKPFGTIICY